MLTNEGLIESIRQEIAAEYSEPHNKPWIIGYSGGKDSTLVCHLVIEHLLSLPRSKQVRPIHIVANDTLVESPLVINHISEVLSEISHFAKGMEIPVIVTTTSPNSDQTFWINLIGRGYPTPNRSFRWCTDRMKIQPTSQYIHQQVNDAGEVILLLGVRRSESSARAAMVSKYDNGQRLHKHSDLRGCYVFRPISELKLDDVWDLLSSNNPPWGGSHQQLIDLYRDAGGGECPVVTSKEDAPSCGTTSSRFGCWTCTVVEKDKSLTGFVEAGYDRYLPLLEFRDWLVSIRNDPSRRLARRRDGKLLISKKGALVPRAFNLATRKEILDRLLTLQNETGMSLIKDYEIENIQNLWINEVLERASNKKTKEWYNMELQA